ncbi:flippase [Planctomycetota bacterium]
MSEPAKTLQPRVENGPSGELLKGSAAVLALRLLGVGATYVFILLVTRGAGVEAMGVFALSYAALEIAALIARAGFDLALLRFTAEHAPQGRWDRVRGAYAHALRVVVPLGLLVSAALYFAAPYLADSIFLKPHLRLPFRLAAVGVLPMALVLLHSEGLRGLKKVSAYAFLSSASAFLLGAALLAPAILYWNGTAVPVGAFVAGLLVTSVVATALWAKNLRVNSVGPLNDNLVMGQMLDVALPLVMATALMLVIRRTDTIMLGTFRTAAEVGVYDVAVRVATFTSITLFAVSSLAAPKFGELFGQGDLEGLGKVARDATRLSFFSSVPCIVLFMLFPAFVLGLFGPEFREGAPALVVLLLGYGFLAAAGPVGFILQMTGRQWMLQRIMLGGAVINIVLNALLIPRYGIVGAAFASTATIVCYTAAQVVYVRQALGISTFYMPRSRGRLD